MEKVYNNVKNSGILGIILGICTVVVGILTIASGIVLLRHRKNILF